MLTTEFNNEMGALLRALQSKVRTEPNVRKDDPLDQIERAIIALVEIHIALRQGKTRP